LTMTESARGKRTMLTDDKRTRDSSPADVQLGNREWWTRHPMTYDWMGDIRAAQYSAEWFDAVDAAHLFGSRLFATEDRPFDRIMPLDRLRGLRALEIGCGMGLHTETLARAGADVVAIDLTPTAIEATRKRLELKNLHARVQQMDAESLAFDTASFDFVWSWGVIHHSANTARIVRNIARVLEPNGECRVMVYNRQGWSTKMMLLRDHWLSGGFLRRSSEETLYRASDGYSARFYLAEQFEDLFRAFFSDVSSEICGQDVDAVPLPASLRRLALNVVPRSYLQAAQARRGSFIFLTAKNLLQLEPGTAQLDVTGTTGGR
jgi:2-polyprenyl-3-methyl-5-hydroxy-6-metoxy-1,4-benzoquinol methylase